MPDEPQTLKQSVLEMLEETFENPQGYYLDRAKGGLFTSLEAISSEVASRETRKQRSIAAHVEHVRFYVEVLHRAVNGDTTRANWNKSWLTHAVTQAEWDALRADLRREYGAFMTELRAVTDEDPRLTEGMAVLTHTAYHFGAIRQLLLQEARG